VREDGAEPLIRRAEPGRLAETVAAVARVERAAVDPGQVAVVCTSSIIDEVCQALEEADIAYGRATRHGLEHRVTVVEVSLVKGLEVDAVIVVEPSLIVAEQAQGNRALYVALTRATKRLAIVHEEELPESLLD
jgi:DNA helicase IV